MPNELQSQDNYFAVLDIGSNSVRFVVYTNIARTPDTVFNEKVLCGLGKEIGSSGAMDQKAMDKAIAAIKRFAALSRQMKVKNTYSFATAAVRDASNGDAFIKLVNETTGYSVDVLEGAEEARLAALGVISGYPGAKGIVGDLGGGSLELARVDNGKVYECISLPIGPLRLLHQTAGDHQAFKGIVKSAFKTVSWLKDSKDQNLYLVGGAWRNIARLLLISRKEPIAVLQGFNVPAKTMKEFVATLAKMDIDDLPNKSLIPPRRREILPEAAYLLKKLISKTKMTNICVSSFGVREGAIYDRLDSDQQQLDPLLYSCRSVAQERSRFPEHGDMLYEWIKPLFPKLDERNPQLDRLNKAVCILSDIAWRAHPDYKAERAVEFALHGKWLDVTHRDRAYLGVALNQAYGGKYVKPYIRDVLSLLSKKEQMQARALGAASRLAHRLSGGAVEALSNSKLQMDSSQITLLIDRDHDEIYGSIVKRRLKVLSALLERDYEVILE